MNGFAFSLAAFVLLHVGVSATGLRARLAAAMGEGLYRALFALASIAVLAWMIWALGAVWADPFDPLNEPLWAPPAWLHWPGVALNLLGLTLAFTGVLTPGPTKVAIKPTGPSPDAARGVLRISRHPFLWGVALWGAGHLLLNGERWAVMLFGALGAMAIYGARSIDRKCRARDPEGWASFEAVTSSVPFVAIGQSRNRFNAGEIGWRALAGLAITVVIALAHQRLFGVPAFSTSP
jgi:uncharacterized membrane protein